MAEGGGLLNRYTLHRRIEGSNPSVSAILLRATRQDVPESASNRNSGARLPRLTMECRSRIVLVCVQQVQRYFELSEQEPNREVAANIFHKYLIMNSYI